MKIRIKGNSIRFRLTQSEVKTLTETGFIEEKTDFGSNTFSYAVKASTDSIEIEASYVKDKMVLHIPKNQLKDWYTNDNVGFEHTQQLSTGTTLSLLLEKDFTCLDNRLEDQTDNYPNPKSIR